MRDYTRLISPGGYMDMGFFNMRREGNECHVTNFFVSGHSRPLGIIRSVVRTDYQNA